MHILSALVSGAALVAAAPGMAARGLAPALPVDAFNTMDFMGSTLEQAKAKPKQAAPALVKGPKFNTFATGQCTNPRYRIEWDRLGDDQKQNWVNSIKCLMQRPPSGKYNIANNRYEDLVALHQIFTPNVHGNSKFLIWHRYFLWTFEDLLRKECGLTTAFPWFDETRYAGHFRDSSVFSSRWLGGVAYNGNCVTDGQFAGLTLNIGPGTSNQPHCLSRNGDGSKTANCNSDFVNECNSRDNYADMESCAEGGPHAWGHNGIGAVMGDVYGSPGDPTFWLHHAFVDRNYRIWQNQDSNRVRYVNGNDVNGNPLTLDMDVSVYGIRPNVKIGDILDTLGPTLCYRYDY